MPEVTVKHMGDMKFESLIGNHKLIIDVPPELNGKDRGPTPPELFITSLASCIAVYATSACKNAGIDAQGLSTTLSFDIFMSKLGNLKAVIKIPKEVGKRDRAILHAAKHCFINETIRSAPEVEITLEK
jgi:putative redox protein